MLTVEVEYLSGVAYSARVDDRGAPEWPPHPDRLFSAFVSAWGDNGCDVDERRALEWLESLAPPQIVASPAQSRYSLISYVPVPDESSLPWNRSRKERTFPAVVPRTPRVHFIWPGASADAEILSQLRRMGSRLSYLGHSASLVRVDVRSDEPAPVSGGDVYQPGNGVLAFRWITPGRLRELESGFAAARASGEKWRPTPGPALRYAAESRRPLPVPTPCFGERWAVWESDAALPLTSFAVVAQRFRQSLIRRAEENLRGVSLSAEVREILTGRSSNGRPSNRAHMAVVPLANVGWNRYSDGGVLGVAIILPRDLERWDDPIAQEIRRLVASVIEVQVSLYGCIAWNLKRVAFADRASLKSERYICGQGSKLWGTVTPIVLDRFPKDCDGKREADLVESACLAIGLPAPTRVALTKYSALSGAPGAWRTNGNPQWTDWAFPSDGGLGKRPRTHAMIEFDQAVRGPLLLGAARYHGMGLCLPMNSPESAESQ